MSIIQDAVGFAVFADTSGVDSALAEMGGSAASIGADLEGKLAGASEGMKELGKRSSGASRGIQGLAAVISLVDPRLGQVVRSVGTLARGLSVLKLGLGPAAVAVAAVTGALAIYQHQQRQAAEEAEAAEQRMRDLTGALQDQHDIYLDLQTQIDLVNGTTDRFAVEYERRKERIEAAGQAVTDALDAEIAATEEKIRVQEQERRVSVEQQAIVKRLKEELAGLNAERRDAVGVTQRQIADAAALAEYHRSERESTEFLRRREEERREAARRRAQAEREAAEATRERQRQEQAFASLQAEVLGAEREARLAVMSDEARLQAQLQARIDRLHEIARLSQDAIDVEGAELALRMQAAQQLGDIRQRQHEEEMARQEAQRAAIEAREKLEREAALAQIQVATDLAGTTSRLVAQGFRDKHAAMIAEGTSAALLAGINTIATNPTPLGIAQAGLNVALAMAQVARMRAAQPSFHSGGFADEIPATLTRGEAVLSPLGRQTMGDHDIRRANAGQAPKGRSTRLTIFQKNRHRPFGDFLDDHLKLDGPLTNAIAGESRSSGGYDGD